MVEIRWLTSWENAAAQHLAPALGLPPFPVQLSVTADKEWDSAGLHWKTGETLEVLKERRPVIWTDDDAWAFDDEEDTVASTSRLPNMTLQESVVRTAASDVPLLMIAPDRRLGLTPEHIATIDAFARLHST